MKSGVLGADGVCMTFMKQIAGELDGRSVEKRRGAQRLTQALELTQPLEDHIAGLLRLCPPDEDMFWLQILQTEID